jgi:hypothetical protein
MIECAVIATTYKRFDVLKLKNFNGWHRAFGPTSDCPYEEHPWKLLTDCPRSCRIGWNIIGLFHTILSRDLEMHQISEKNCASSLTGDLLRAVDEIHEKYDYK